MKMIECEIRSFLTDAQYERLMRYFEEHTEEAVCDEQVTYYFSGGQDLRIQKNSRYSKIWLKKGALHDDQREEIEVRCPVQDFANLEKLFLALGYTVEIKWFRNRCDFKWGGISVSLDDTRGYGKIIELELLVPEGEKDAALNRLKSKMSELNVPITPKEEFARAYAHYKEHWRELVGECGILEPSMVALRP